MFLLPGLSEHFSTRDVHGEVSIALSSQQADCKDEFMTLLQPLLQCVRGRSRLSFSQSMLEGCHRRLIGVLAERIPGTKAMARKAARALVATQLQLALG